MAVALAVRLITVAATAAAARRAPACRWIAFGGSIAASIMTLAIAARVLGSGQAVEGVLFRHGASGLVLGYAVTPLSAWFLLVGPDRGAGGGLQPRYFAHAVAPRGQRRRRAFNVLLGGLEASSLPATPHVPPGLGSDVARDGALVTTEHQSRDSRRDAFLYRVMSHIGTGCLLAGLLLLAGRAGSLTLPAVLAGNLVAGPARHGVFLLFLLGFGVKAGIIPLHVWLPEAHPAAPSSVSALMSAVLITAGVYGLFRVCAFGLGVPDMRWGLALMAAGTLSALLGVLYALTQNDSSGCWPTHDRKRRRRRAGPRRGHDYARAGRGRLAAHRGGGSLAHVLIRAFKAPFLAAGGIVGVHRHAAHRRARRTGPPHAPRCFCRRDGDLPPPL